MIADPSTRPAGPIPPRLLDEAETLGGALSSLAAAFPDFECLTIVDRRGGEQRLSLRELWSRARLVQGDLVRRGLGRGDFALLALPTSPELVCGYFAVLLAGAIPGLLATPSNRVADPRAYAAHVSRILANADATVLYTNDEVARLFQGEDRPPLGRTAIVTAGSETASDPPPPIVTTAPDDIATVQYSSGSTGSPKGVLLSHRAMLNNIRAVRDGLGLTPADVSVNWIPLYHDMGLIDAFLLPLLTGTATILIPTMDFLREPGLWLRAVDRHRGTLSWAPNFAYALCVKRVPDEELSHLDLSSWRIAINAAEPVLPHTIAQFAERFAPRGFAPEAMTPAWGLAENVTIATAHPVAKPPIVETIDRTAAADEDIARPTSGDGFPCVAVGRCLPCCEIEIRDANGRALGERRIGSVWLRTNSLLTRYHGDPELTAKILVDGWLDTGDRGYLADGNLYFLSRDKDLIVIAGAKYSPHDVETAINRVPGVRQGCAVAFGVIDPETGTEELMAVAETHETAQESHARIREAAQATVRKSIGLTLRDLVLVPPGGIEKTTSGKLARRATQKRYEHLLHPAARGA